MGNGRDGEKKSKGLLGLLFGGATMLKNGVSWIAEKIFGKSILRAWLSMGKFATLGLKILPTIGSGIASIATVVGSLIKGDSIGDAIDKMKESWGGGDSDEDERPHRRRHRRRRRNPPPPRPRPNLLSKFTKGIKGLSLGAVVGYGADALVDSGLVEQGGTTEAIANGINTAASIYGGFVS